MRHKMHRVIGVIIIGIALVVVALACGDDPPPSPTPVARTAETAAAEPTATQTSAPEPSDSLRLSAGESGVLEHESGARIEIPQGATDEAVTVSITEVEPSDDKLPAGRRIGHGLRHLHRSSRDRASGRHPHTLRAPARHDGGGRSRPALGRGHREVGDSGRRGG